MESRYEIQIENYCKIIQIESNTMLSMVRSDILPAVCEYTKKLGESVLTKMQLNSDITFEYEKNILKNLSNLCSKLYKSIEELALCNEKLNNISDIKKSAYEYKNSVLKIMQKTRSIIDELEINMPKKYWPFPTYEDILFSV